MVRIEWQCPECKICQKCRRSDDENKVLVCDSCDKCYHTYCTKYAANNNESSGGGWKCEVCSRLCLNCNVIISKENDSFCFDCAEIKRNFPPEKVSFSIKFKTPNSSLTENLISKLASRFLGQNRFISIRDTICKNGTG